MALDLYLFRHGESEVNLDFSIVSGQSNHSELSPRGVKQAECLGQRLKQEGIAFDEAYSSKAVRAVSTAKIVLDILGFKGQVPALKELLELSQGDLEGRKVSDVYTPETIAKMQRQTWDYRAPNGESQRDVEKRFYGWVVDHLIRRRDQNVKVGLFGHGLAIKCLTRGILNSNPSLTYRIDIDNCSITHFRYIYSGPHRGWSLVKLNDNAHLLACGFKSRLRE